MASDTVGHTRSSAPLWLARYPQGVDWYARFEPRPFFSIFDRAVALYPQRPFVEFLGRRFTYQEIDALVTRTAAGLQALGVGPGVKVGIFLPNCPYSVIFMFAVLKTGGIVVNFNPLYAEREIEFQIADSGVEIMVTVDLQLLAAKLIPFVQRQQLRGLVVCRFATCLPLLKSWLFSAAKRKDVAALPAGDAYVRFEQLLDLKTELTPVAVDPDDVALIQYTGGTTGVPAGAVHTHATLAINSDQIAAWAPGLDHGEERILGVLPLFHIFALSTVLSLGARIGAELVLLPRFDLRQVLKTIASRRPTILPGVPTMYNAIASHPEIGRYRLSSIRICISGGAPLPLEVKQTFEKKAGCIIAEGYGLTESQITHCNPVEGLHKAGSVGLPLPGTTVEIVSLEDRSTVMPPGERGEICVRGPQVMKGYHRRSLETAASLRQGRLHTGDVGYLDEEGYCFVVDRIKELVICSGYNVYPRLIEEAIYLHPDVREAAVIGIPDSYRGETVKAFVVLRPGSRLGESDLLAFLKDKLSAIEMPKIVEFRSELPKSPIGKILKKVLVAEERAGS